MNWALYVNHPFDSRNQYNNVFECSKIDDAIGAAKEVPSNWGCYICNLVSKQRYNRFGIGIGKQNE
jgi:hypothetical protein